MNPNPQLQDMEAMRAGAAYTFEVKLRQKVWKLRPLTVVEIGEINRSVASQIADLPEPQRLLSEESPRIAIASLEKASCSAPGVFDPSLSALIAKSFTGAELDYIWRQYVAGCERCNPSLELLSTEQVSALLEEVKKSPLGVSSALIEKSFLDLVSISSHLIQTASLTDKLPG